MRQVLSLLVLTVACSHSAPPPQYAPSEVTDLATLPDGYVSGGSLSESCVAVPRGSFDDVALSDVDCSFARLSRTLAARAGEQGARFLVGKRCRGRSGSRLSCTAVMARRTEQVPLQTASVAETAPAPSAAQVRDLDDPRPQDAIGIRVTFDAAGDGGKALPPRAYDQVAETSSPSVGRRALGQVSARCDWGCESSRLRYALRVTAGRAGAGEVSDFACFEEGEGTRCVATALVPWSS